jgi:hypothetical protein
MLFTSQTLYQKGKFKMLIPSLYNIRFGPLQRPPDSKHLISQFVSSYTEASTSHLKENWGKEFNIDISDDLWGEALSRITPVPSMKISINTIQSQSQNQMTYNLTPGLLTV